MVVFSPEYKKPASFEKQAFESFNYVFSVTKRRSSGKEYPSFPGGQEDGNV
jgi:hypothetical protein